MARRLILVETVRPLTEAHSLIMGLGYRPHLLLTPEVVLESGERFRPGDIILLKRPFGSTLVTRISGFSRLGGYGFAPPGIWVNYENCLVIPDSAPEDIPVGTEVWSVDRPRRDRRRHKAE